MLRRQPRLPHRIDKEYCSAVAASLHFLLNELNRALIKSCPPPHNPSSKRVKKQKANIFRIYGLFLKRKMWKGSSCKLNALVLRGDFVFIFDMLFTSNDRDNSKSKKKKERKNLNPKLYLFDRYSERWWWWHFHDRYPRPTWRDLYSEINILSMGGGHVYRCTVHPHTHGESAVSHWKVEVWVWLLFDETMMFITKRLASTASFNSQELAFLQHVEIRISSHCRPKNWENSWNWLQWKA